MSINTNMMTGSTNNSRNFDVIVVGAGIAGLTAARTLAETDRRVLVLEAQDRIGGRIHTVHIGDDAIELGAEFVHGRPAELLSLIEEAGLDTYERGGTRICFEEDKLCDCEEEMDEDIFDPLEALEDFTGPDLSFAQYIAQQNIPEEKRREVSSYIEGFNAADSTRISTLALGVQQRAEDAIEGDRVFRLRGGYDQLPAYLAERIAHHGGTILTGTAAQSIRWSPGLVTITSTAGEFTAPRAVITLPLAVLQSDAVPITPTPTHIREAAQGLVMGQARRISLRFREPFWHGLAPQPQMQQMNFLFSFSEIPPVWWTTHPEPSSILTGWIGGTRAEALASLPDEDLAQRTCATLAKIFSLPEDHIRELLLGCHTHDWQSDPLFGGAYSYVTTGGLDASRTMSQPVANTLFFAGEHTDVTGHWGTVHGAIRSGLRAAQQVAT